MLDFAVRAQSVCVMAILMLAQKLGYDVVFFVMHLQRFPTTIKHKPLLPPDYAQKIRIDVMIPASGQVLVYVASQSACVIAIYRGVRILFSMFS